MKTISGTLLTYLQTNNEFTLADLYTITLINGTVKYYTDFDVDLVYGGNTYSSSGPTFVRSKTRTTIGLEVDTLDIEIYPKPTDLLNGLPMLAAGALGSFDGAYLKLDRAYIGPVPTVIGTINIFSGTFADLEVARAGMKARINSDVAQFSIQMPRNIYQANCLNSLFDADCGLSRSSFAVAGTDSGGSSTTIIMCSLSQPTSFFNMGYVVWNTGMLAGLKRTIKGYWQGSPGNGNFAIYNPLPNAPASGDQMTLYPGCDKTLSTCQSKFSNQTKFRGMPFIPVPETAI